MSIYPALLAKRDLAIRWGAREPAKRHGLPGQLIVSLTSYPARFETLPLTLKCLLTQTVSADRIILWIAHGDMNSLTEDILRLKSEGLEILYCDDLRSYKKIIPALEFAPEAFIVTADDDLYFDSIWLEQLVASYAGNNKEVLCHRAHKIKLDEYGLPLSYDEWEYETRINSSNSLIFPTSGAGALYPPGIFYGDISDDKKFLEFCPDADDIWLYWMIRLSGRQARKVGERSPLIVLAKDRHQGLWVANVAGKANDTHIQTMIRRYGFSI